MTRKIILVVRSGTGYNSDMLQHKFSIRAATLRRRCLPLGREAAWPWGQRALSCPQRRTGRFRSGRAGAVCCGSGGSWRPGIDAPALAGHTGRRVLRAAKASSASRRLLPSPALKLDRNRSIFHSFRGEGKLQEEDDLKG